MLGKIKIFHIITGLQAHGAEKMLLKLVSGSDKNQFDIVVISLSSHDQLRPEFERIIGNVKIINCKGFLALPIGFLRLLKLLILEKPDIVQTWMYHADLIGGLAAKLARIKFVIWNLRHTYSGDEKLFIRAVVKICCLMSFYIPNLILCNSFIARKKHIAIGYKKNIFVVPNGFETDTFKPGEDRKHFRDVLGISEHTFLIGMVARNHPQKDHNNFIRAASIIIKKADKPIHFVLCGTDIDVSTSIRKKVDDYGLGSWFTLLGEVEDVVGLYNCLDLFTLTSSFGEAFPNVVGEAMSCGVPCVVTDVGDVKKIVGNAGWVVEKANSQVLSDVWHDVLQLSPEQRIAVGKLARERIISRYEIAHIVNEYSRIYYKNHR